MQRKLLTETAISPLKKDRGKICVAIGKFFQPSEQTEKKKLDRPA
jgi:hypothetical protein